MGKTEEPADYPEGDKCPECGKDCASELGLKQHFTRQHSELKRGDQFPWVARGDVECPTCGQLCATVGGMRRHHFRKHGKSLAKVERTCRECGEVREMYESKLEQLEHDDLCVDCARKRSIPHDEEARKKMSENSPEEIEWSEEAERARREGFREWLESGGREQISEQSKGRSVKHSDETRQKISETLTGHEVSEETRQKIRENSTPGRRLSIEVEATGHTVRSYWEEEIDLLLHRSAINYEYEPETFDIGDGTYLPDFRVQDTIIEVKGYADEYSKERAQKFMNHYPQFRYLVLGDGDVPHDAHISWEERDDLLERL